MLVRSTLYLYCLVFLVLVVILVNLILWFCSNAFFLWVGAFLDPWSLHKTNMALRTCRDDGVGIFLYQSQSSISFCDSKVLRSCFMLLYSDSYHWSLCGSCGERSRMQFNLQFIPIIYNWSVCWLKIHTVSATANPNWSNFEAGCSGQIALQWPECRLPGR